MIIVHLFLIILSETKVGIYLYAWALTSIKKHLFFGNNEMIELNWACLQTIGKSEDSIICIFQKERRRNCLFINLRRFFEKKSLFINHFLLFSLNIYSLCLIIATNKAASITNKLNYTLLFALWFSWCVWACEYHEL